MAERPKIDMTVLEAFPRRIVSADDLVRAREVISTVIGWVYPLAPGEQPDVTRQSLVLGVQAGLLHDVLTQMERLLAEATKP